MPKRLPAALVPLLNVCEPNVRNGSKADLSRRSSQGVESSLYPPLGAHSVNYACQTVARGHELGRAQFESRLATQMKATMLSAMKKPKMPPSTAAGT
jgi:hypothetical protein